MTLCSTFHCDVLVEGIRLHEHAVHGSHGAGVKPVDVLVESRRATEHVIHGHHMALVSKSLTFWLETFASQNTQDVIVMAPVWETDARRLGEE